MIKKIKKGLKSVGISLAVAMAKGDKELLKGSGEATSEKDGMVSRSYSENESLRAIQTQQFSQAQIAAHYKMLDYFDKVHGRRYITKKIADGYFEDVTDENGKQLYNKDGTPKQIWIDEPIFDSVLMNDEDFFESKQKLGDVVEGFETFLWLKNKPYQVSDVSIASRINVNAVDINIQKAFDDFVIWDDTLKIERKDMTYGIPRIEDYNNEIFIKKEIGQSEDNHNYLIEFYCSNFNVKQAQKDNKMGIFSDEIENAYLRINQPNILDKFTNFKSFNIKEHTATRNDIEHRFENLSFDSIKKLDKGFVVKFMGDKVENNGL